MSLNYYYYPNGDTKLASNVHHPIMKIETPEGDRTHPIAEYLIWAFIPIGMRGITKKNVDKVLQRLTIYQWRWGPAVKFHDGEQAFITREDVERYIGLEVNVTDITDAEFGKRVLMWGHDTPYKPRDNSRGLSAFALYEEKRKEVKE